MTVLRGFVITIASGIAFAIVGACVGYALGVIAPDYYRVVFAIPAGPPVNLAHVGLGLGVIQGAGAGVVIGLVIVVAVAWYNSRITQRPSGML